MTIQEELLVKKVKPFYLNNMNYYHTKFHVVSMLEGFNDNKKALLREFPYLDTEKLKTAIAWHDAGYVPGSNTNEELAADLYKDNTENPYPEVIAAILSTKADNKVFKTDLEKVLHDLDWSCFRNTVSLLSAQHCVEEEYVALTGCSKEDFYRGRLAFYKGLDAANIFQTDTFKFKFGDGAEEAVERRISKLEEELQPMSVIDASGKEIPISCFEDYTVIYDLYGHLKLQMSMQVDPKRMDRLGRFAEDGYPEDVCIPLTKYKDVIKERAKVLKVFTDEKFNQLVKEKILNE